MRNNLEIFMVGCGFLGSLFIEEVLKRGFASGIDLRFVVVDDDAVEARNVANSAFMPNQEGYNKAHLLHAKIKRYDEHAGGTYCVERFEEKTLKHFEDHLKKAHIIVSAVDNVEARLLLWQESVKRGIPLLSLGLSQAGQGAVEWTVEAFGIETNTFTPQNMALADYKENLEELPPCDLVGMRGAGLNVALAASKALFIFAGFNPENEGLVGEPVVFTTWQADNHGHRLMVSHLPTGEARQ